MRTEIIQMKIAELQRHKKLILYISIPIVSIVFLYLLAKIFILIISIFHNPAIIGLIYAVIGTIYFLNGIPFILKKLSLRPHDDWINFLFARDLKIKYYKLLIKILKLWDVVAIVSIIFILIGLILFIINLFIANATNLIEIKNFILKILTISLTTHIAILFMWLFIVLGWVGFFGFGMLGLFFIFLIFPRNKVSGFPDATDIPVSFIEKAKVEVVSFDFSLTWEEKQRNKIKISNLLNNALEFMSPKSKFSGIPGGSKYYQQFIGDLKNKSSMIDVLYRINGLSKKLEEIIVELNYMNTEADKENLANSLTKYLDIIRNRKLCEIEPIKYTDHGIIGGIIERLNPFIPFFHLINKP